MTNTQHRGLTRVDLIVVLAAVGLLLAMALPGLARGAAAGRMLGSQANLRTLGVAHTIYAMDWNGRQLTFVDDLIATYGSGPGDAFLNYYAENQREHPGVALGWGRLQPEDPRYFWLEYRTRGNCANAVLTLPVAFTGDGCNPALVYLGAFRLHNADQFNRYLGGRFYDEAYYAPEDTVVIDAIDDGDCFDVPGGFCREANVSRNLGEIPAWSSYCLSPAAMFSPSVLAHDDPDDPMHNGFRDPWDMPDGFRSPAVFQARYAHLKTQMLEHHWLRDNKGVPPCNPAFEEGTYGDDPGCEPYYFNHGASSRPETLFYDGHVAGIVAADAEADDAQAREQMGAGWGLWSRDTSWGADGYLSQLGYDTTATSFHILTTDGILGRDILEPGGLRPHRDRARRPVVGRRAVGGAAQPGLPAVRTSIWE